MDQPTESATTRAIKEVIAGKCPECQQTRIEKTIPIGGNGFGAVASQKKIFVCGNILCPNCGK